MVPPNDPYLAMDKCGSDFVDQNKNLSQADLVCRSPGISPQQCIKQTRSSATFPFLNCSTS